MTRVLLTGATGFVGSHLRPLLRGAGYGLRLAVRDPTRVDPEGDEICMVEDIGPDTDWERALDGVDLVVHAAARVHVMKETAKDPLAAHRQVNTLGTLRLAEVAATAGVRRLVFISTVKVMGEVSGPQPFSDAVSPRPSDPYGVAKLEAERGLVELHRVGRIETVILRPPLVYGPGVKGNFRTLMALCRSGVPLPCGAMQNCRSFIYVGNLCDAIIQALSHPKAAGGAFLISDGKPMSTADLIRHIGAAMRRRPLLLPVPPKFLETAATLLGYRAQLQRVLGNLEIDDERFRSLLGWVPPVPATTGIQATVEWYLNHR